MVQMDPLPDPRLDLASVFHAMGRGTRRSRLRVMTLVCLQDHTLIEVYRGATGTLWGLYSSNSPGSGRARGSRPWYAVDLSNHRHSFPATVIATWPVNCRCPKVGSMWTIPVGPLVESVLKGEKRLVAEPEWNGELSDDVWGRLQRDAGPAPTYSLGARTRVVP